MRAQKISVLVAVAVAVGIHLDASVARTPKGRLTLYVTDSFGNAIQGWQVLECRDQAGKDWAHAFHGDASDLVPYGSYLLRVWQGPFLPSSATVAVNRPLTTYRVGLTFAGIENSPPVEDVHGKFASPPGESSWCKLSGVYSTETSFAEVQRDGTFYFPFVRIGSYVLLCQLGSRNIGLRTLDVRRGSTPNVLIGD